MLKKQKTKNQKPKTEKKKKNGQKKVNSILYLTSYHPADLLKPKSRTNFIE